MAKNRGAVENRPNAAEPELAEGAKAGSADAKGAKRAGSELLLQVSGLSFRYGNGHEVFHNVSFTLERGQVISLLGPNGAGKSTLLDCVDGLASPYEGSVVLHGKPVQEYDARTLAQHVAYVHQDISVVYGYTVREYMVMGAAPRLGMFQTPGPEEYARVDDAIHRLDLDDLAERTVSELSGGERQRVAIARAIVQDPQIILFDEPTSALDYGNQIRVLRTIKQLSDSGYAIIMTTHNPDQPILLSGTVAMLNRDGTLSVGTAEETLSSKSLSELYQTELHLVKVAEVDRVACVSAKLE